MKTSFPELLSNNKVIIPIIQRDFAQGRSDNKAQRIRKDFLDALFEILNERVSNPASQKNLELDFIYGFGTQDGAFTSFSPIDGQQRLTTLWLLWWFVAVKENISDRGLLSNFRYETRHSSTVFCEKILAFKPAFNQGSISKEIKNQPWYFDTWDYDPGICAMLVMLDDIQLRYGKLNSTLWPVLNHAVSPFCFYKLDMDKVGLPDDLYIKMNSRGKPLTEFEYFKANFAGIITIEGLKKRFQVSIDQDWAEAIWKIVYKKQHATQTDIALAVDSCFIRLINFITDVLAFKQEIPFSDITGPIAETARIYQHEENLCFLFDVLDQIVAINNSNESFWDESFYLDKEGFVPGKTRLFFQHGQTNLLEKCLFSYTKNSREFPFPEQLLLYACFIHWLNDTADFSTTARIVRNLVANSSNELRNETIGFSFKEVENFVLDRDFSSLKHFKTDQIKEEQDKQDKINNEPFLKDHIGVLEDSDLLRGCISIFDIDNDFIGRKDSFLKVFDEDIIIDDFISRANLLLCFGDYSQDEGVYINLLARSKANWRTFFTTPAFNKQQLGLKTKVVLMECLDFFNVHPSILPNDKINDTLLGYGQHPKDWKYYFLKYRGFRMHCNKGYYYWNENDHYPLYKMKERQFNGYHWDPFLKEAQNCEEDFLNLDNGGKMQFICGDDMFWVESRINGFAFLKNGTGSEIEMVKLLEVQQEDGKDLEDRIEKLRQEIKAMLKERI